MSHLSGSDPMPFSCNAGGPGSGKSLQSERMEERFGVRRLTVGDLLCHELQSHSNRGRHLRDALERGEPLPQECLLELLCEAVSSSVRMGRSSVICGFPRDARQAQGYEDKLGEPSLVLLLSCSPETMCQRGLRSGTSRAGTDTDTDREAESERSSDQFVRESRTSFPCFCGNFSSVKKPW
uniref:Nucleoside-diphosphate kinase n=1 Tax=Neogobius melanostomus TaxID=47308 RepID=A0A8C6TPQ5_9GOBI